MIPNFRLSDVIPSAKELHSYYRYVGSMTTPGCEQAVAWTVFHRTLPISSRQVSTITTTNRCFFCTHLIQCKRPFGSSPLQLDAIALQCRFWTGQPMTDIFRPTQPLDGRVVYRSKASAALTSVIHLWFGALSVVLGTTGLIH